MEQDQDLFTIGPWRVAPSLNRIEGVAGEVQVEPRIMQVLLCLVERAGEVVTRDALMETVWADTFVGDDPLNRAISELRKIFGDTPRHPQYIETIRKSGYRLIAPVASLPPAPATPPEANSPQRARPSFKWGAVMTGLLLVVAGRWWLQAQRPLPPSQPMPLTTYTGREYDPALSPDGARIAFSWDGQGRDTFNVHVRQFNTETPLQLTAGGKDFEPAWSPDGQTIAFMRVDAESCEVLTVPAIGGPERRLVPCHVSQPTSLDWSPTGKHVAFVDRAAVDAPHRVFLLDLETRDVTPLTDPPPSFLGDENVTFSTDGAMVYFTRISISGIENIFRVNLSGEAPEQLTNENQRITGLTVVHRDHILYTSDRQGIFSVWQWRMGMHVPSWLASGGDAVHNVHASPVHRRLVYEQQILDKNLWRIRLDAPAATPHLFIASTRWDFSPDFSPDGERLVFVSNRSGSYEIWLAEADGTQAVPLTAFNGPIVGGPRWSPDGQQIAFDARTEGRADLFTIDVVGGLPQRLTHGAADAVLPSWTPDGEALYFSSNQTGQWELWRQPLAGGTAVQVTSAGGFASKVSADGQWLYYTKRTEEGLWRQAVWGGPEEAVLPDFPSGMWANWLLTPTGLYFIERPPNERVQLQYLDFATQTTTHRQTLDFHITNPGLALSPDGATLLFAQVDRHESDLMYLERF